MVGPAESSGAGGRVEGLPNVPQAEADRVRLALQRRRYVPNVHQLPEQVLPDPSLVRVIDQGPEGVSVGVALAATLNYLRARRGETALVSPRMLYEFARRYDEFGGTDYEGSSVAGALAGLSERGVCLDSEWPLNAPPRPPLAETLQRARANRPAAILRIEPRREALQAAVQEHQAVVVSFHTHAGWSRPAKGRIPYERGRKGEYDSEGGHAVAVLGYTPEGFLVQNSWGEAWSTVTLDGRRYRGMAIWSYDDAEDHLTDAWTVVLAGGRFRPPQVTYDADSLDGPDLLEIRAEVEAFSYVLASPKIRPPLALGLFGDWGSGKSFFMRAMRHKIDRLAERERQRPAAEGEEPRFCRRVTHVPFNAWHYLDADLWSSLVTEVFDRLFESIEGAGERPEDRLARLRLALGDANGMVQQAQRQLDEARAARTAAETALAAAAAERDRREGRLATQLDDLASLLAGQPELRQALASVAADLGMPEVAQSYAALKGRVGELGAVGRRAAALLQAMFLTPWGWPRLAGLVGALLVPVGIVALLELAQRQAWLLEPIRDFHSFALQLSGGLVALTGWVAAQARRGAALVTRLEDTQRQLERIREARRATMLEQEHDSLQTAAAQEDAARRALVEAEARVQSLEREIEGLRPGRLLARFIEERARSGDYRARLGIVSLVRRDFERLSELSDPRSGRHDAQAMPVERIVLYVDDLDRCKPDRVVEVLEAVHLLLAFPLFMVVVAVDPRWLRHCLEKHYPDLLTLREPEPAGTGGLPTKPATAQDYLEKIFQIPFLLQPLRDDGFRRMVQGLTAGSVAAAPVAPVGGAPAPAPPVAAPAVAAAATGPVPDAPVAPAPGPAATAAAQEDEVDDDEVERLALRPWEVQDMERLALFFRTPRAVKRFVNTYRFLRAGVRTHELGLFEGQEGQPGTYGAVMLLLAVVVNHAAVAPRFLHRVASAAPPRTAGWAPLLKALRADPARAPAARKAAPPALPPAAGWDEVEWRLLFDTLQRIADSGFAAPRLEQLQAWARTVARFSFSLTATSTLLEA